MSVALEKALEHVALVPGQIYRCRVNGLRVELRVSPESVSLLPAEMSGSDVMLDAWVEFPLPAGVRVDARSEAILLPDPPDMPPEEEE